MEGSLNDPTPEASTMVTVRSGAPWGPPSPPLSPAALLPRCRGGRSATPSVTNAIPKTFP